MCRAHWILALALASAPLAACASKRPALYPNRHLEAVGRYEAERDVEACLAAADAHGFDARRAERGATSVVQGGAVGGAVGAAAGAVRGHAGRGAATGAAAGGAAGFMRSLFRWREPDRLQARFVNVCLQDRGYRVVGWR